MLSIELDYKLPREKIAQEPIKPRDHARLLLVDRSSEAFKSDIFLHIVNYLRAGDLIVYNQTKVLRARLQARKATGGKVDLLLVQQTNDKAGIALLKSNHRVAVPSTLWIGQTEISVVCREAKGFRIYSSQPFSQLMKRRGKLPLPPYIRKPLQHPYDYQTIFACSNGSVAAPTAALHFTPRLVKHCQEKGVHLMPVCLHIGMDTFLPIKSERVKDHPMHTEAYTIPPSTIQAVKAAKRMGRRVVALGTTVVRALESYAVSGKREGATSLFIQLGYRFKVVDALITNFHFPRSTLLALVMALAGKEKIASAYSYALNQGFRFLSFGDGMLIT